MPKSIAQSDVDRMFPFEFFDELDQVFKEYVNINTAFMGSYSLNEKLKQALQDPEYRKNQFSQSREQVGDLRKKLTHNILEVQPIGDVLLLDQYIAKENIEKIQKNKLSAKKTHITILCAQYYDSSQQPIFEEDVTDESIQQIPEILYDDPNLLLGLIIFGDDAAEFASIRMPAFIEEKILEPKSKK